MYFESIIVCHRSKETHHEDHSVATDKKNQSFSAKESKD